MRTFVKKKEDEAEKVFVIYLLIFDVIVTVVLGSFHVLYYTLVNGSFEHVFVISFLFLFNSA